MANDALKIFSTPTARWFSDAVGVPTAVQAEAWPAIAAGADTLVCAPTGTGKTLSAFLVFIDRLKTQAREGSLSEGLRLIYVSPLKSLAGDIRENLRRPLSGIPNGEGGDPAMQIRVGVRTGDTTQSERRAMIKRPPHILITTPESLFLLLTSQSGQAMLRTARHIIIDEVHALIDSKRGAHLMLSLARLDRLCGKPLQRVGLSATIEPLDLAAEYLSPGKATVAAPKMRKRVSLSVTTPLSGKLVKDPIWNELAAAVFERCRSARTAIAFVEGRAYAEKLAYYVNQIAGDGFARTHHGSLAWEQRAEVERQLRGGELRLLCATSSMELGIDVGEIDQVFQIGCPRSVSSTMQRLGRAGHNPNRVSVMHIFPRAPAEALYSGLAAELARRGGIEHSRPPRLCLDVLAQHLVSMAATQAYTLDEAMALLPRAYPFREVTREDLKDVLRMLAGDFEHEKDLPVRPRLLYDRIHERVEGDAYSRMLAVSAGGTIPDRGLYAVRTDSGVRLGELDEEFVFEARVGDKFLLGAFSWQIASIQKDSVVVLPATPTGARPPFWHGEIKGRSLKTGIAYGEIFRSLSAARESGELPDALRRLGLDRPAAKSSGELIDRQIRATGSLADDRTILIEHFPDESGVTQYMVHSVFGKPVNEPLAILATEEAKRRTGSNIGFVDDDDGFLLYPYGDCSIPPGVLQGILPETARPVLEAVLPATPLFNMAFRYNAARALMMGVRKAGRLPLWLQRLRGADMLDALVRDERHPLIRETRRECLEDYWDLPGVEQILSGIRSGAIRVREIHLPVPSPLSLPLRQQTEASMMYDYAPSTTGINAAVEEALKGARMIRPAPEQLELASGRSRLPENEKQLHSLLMIEGDLIAGELDVPIGYLETLAQSGQAQYIEPGLWIAAEHAEEYARALIDGDREACRHIARRALRYRGAMSALELAARYLWTQSGAEEILTALADRQDAVEHDGLYYHAKLYDRARRATIKIRRVQVRTLSPERYAALLASRSQISAPPGERLEAALNSLSGLFFPPALWEGALLPSRVPNYRPEMLDALLAQGGLFWEYDPEEGIRFHSYEDIAWETDMSGKAEALEGDERIVFNALLERGASFAQRLSTPLGGASAYEALMKLAKKGLIRSDSFAPVRQWLAGDRLESELTGRRIRTRVMTMTAGRWEVSRPPAAPALEQALERAFDRRVILCRETAQGLSWEAALQILRVWEYTGRARRGYFVEGMSGVQFIRDGDFAQVTLALEHPERRMIWLPAVDPALCWGKTLPHMPDRSFITVPGTAVALYAGVPVAVFERQGKTLKVFDEGSLPEALRAFSGEYAARRLFPGLSRIKVTQYPAGAADALRQAGFVREMSDYILTRRRGQQPEEGRAWTSSEG